MTNESMTVHEALTVLKTLDKRIMDEINHGIFVESVKNSSSTIRGNAIEDVTKTIRGSYDSVTTMIRRRAAIRKALAHSNANTLITVNGKSYWVSEAIEMKANGIALLQMLMDTMSKQTAANESLIHRANTKDVPADAERYVGLMFSGKEKAEIAAIDKARKEYIEANSLKLVDPLDIKSKITELRDEIDSFASAVDSALSVSNALTTIYFEY